MDTIIRNVVVAGTTVQFASTATNRGTVASGMNLTFAEIREAVATLRGADARPFPDGFYAGVTHPDGTADLFADSDVLRTFQQAGERGVTNPIFTGEIGVFYKVRWVDTTQARIFLSEGLSGADVYATMIIGQEAYGTHFDGFMRHFLTLKTGDIPNVRAVYEAFKSHARAPEVASAGVDALVAEIHTFAGYYCSMALDKELDKELAPAFRDLRELKVDVAFPFLLELYHDYCGGILPKDDLVRSVRLVE